MNEIIKQEGPPQAVLTDDVQIVQNPSSAEALIAKAIDKGVSIETMEKLLTMRRELKEEWAREQFFKALSKFQSACPEIKKSEDVLDRDGEIRYSFAPLDHIVKQVKDALKDNGFSYIIKAENKTDSVIAVVIVHHVDGYSEETRFEIPIDLKAFMTAPQKVASALTYAKRYAFCNAFGIMTADPDDDGRAAPDAKPKAKPAPAKQNGEQPPRNVTATPKGAPAAQKKSTCDRVGEYITRAELNAYISPNMAALYRKERDEHKADEKRLRGMLTRITAQAVAAKAELDKQAGAAFAKTPPAVESDLY